jgi:tRNA pseudouridine55 synthase
MHFDGILLVDKPQGITSHDVVDVLRKATGIRRIGHTGTLDPRATGLLVLCLGQATRLSQYLSGLDKTYEGAMRLGIASSSHDLDGEIIREVPVDDDMSLEKIQQACNAFIGAIQQVPPMVSAIKIGGKRLYKLARQGQEVERPARPVTIQDFTITCWEPPDAALRIACSSGAYVRTLCDDVGRKLGCGAVLAKLRRTRVGGYSLEDAAPLEALNTPDSVAQRLISMDNALSLPVVCIDKAHEQMIRSGSAISGQAFEGPFPSENGLVQVKNVQGKLIALAAVHPTAAGARIQPKRVFAP